MHQLFFLTIVLSLTSYQDLFYQKFFLSLGLLDDHKSRKQLALLDAYLLVARVETFERVAAIAHDYK